MLYLYCIIIHLTAAYCAIWRWDHIMDSIFSGLTNLFTEKDKTCAELPLFEIELHRKRIMHFSKASWYDALYSFLLARKVNFTSLTSDDKSDSTTFYPFKGDSFSVNLTESSAVIESFFLVIQSQEYFKHWIRACPFFIRILWDKWCCLYVLLLFGLISLSHIKSEVIFFLPHIFNAHLFFVEN